MMGTDSKIFWLKIKAWLWGILGSILYRFGFERSACTPWAIAWGHNDYIQYLEMTPDEKRRLNIDGNWKHQAEWTKEDLVKHEGRPEV
jgi:hypothetical protein